MAVRAIWHVDAWSRLTRTVQLFALVDLSMVELVELSADLFVRREDAERTLAELLRDEPEWRGLFRIEEIELGELELELTLHDGNALASRRSEQDLPGEGTGRSPARAGRRRGEGRCRGWRRGGVPVARASRLRAAGGSASPRFRVRRPGTRC